MGEAAIPPPDEFFDCPVCFETPKGHIYQCKDGHFLCDQCHQKITNCPQCRIPLGNIRSRALESLLSLYKIPCRYRELGCEEMGTKTGIQKHEKTCDFPCRKRTLCSDIGYNCSFKTNLLQPSEFLSHLQTKHMVLVHENSHLGINLGHLMIAKRNTALDVFWTPVILKIGRDKTAPKFLVVFRFDSYTESIWIGCSLLEDPFKKLDTMHSIGFKFKSNSNEGLDLNWKIDSKAFEFVGRTELLLVNPIYKIPISVFDFQKGIQIKIAVENGSLAKGGNYSPPIQLDILNDLYDMKDPSCAMFPKKCGTCLDTLNYGVCSSNIWYKCMQCPVIMCQACRLYGIHLHHVLALLDSNLKQNYVSILYKNRRLKWDAILFKGEEVERKVENETNTIKVFPVQCLNCGCSPILRQCYTCLLCPTKVDFCTNCVECSNVHQHHILGMISTLEGYKMVVSKRREGSSLLPMLASAVNLDDSDSLRRFYNRIVNFIWRIHFHILHVR